MREVGERLYTPNDLSESGIMSHVKQWQERKSGRLQCYRIGRKILYGQRHLDAYFSLCESGEPKKEEASNAA
jgi:hypothetical protein